MMRICGYVLLTVILGVLGQPTSGAEHAEPVLKVVMSIHDETHGGIYVTDGAGTEKKRLTQSHFDMLPQWSPGGDKIGFLTIRPQDQEIVERHDLAFHWFLYRIDAAGGEPQRVTTTPISLFQWSKDGKHILFESSYEDDKNRQRDGLASSAIYVMDMNGQNQRRLTPVEGTDHFASWSPDGRHIAFCTGRSGQFDLYVMHSDGSNLQQLTDSPAAPQQPVWSPDSRRIAFASFDRGQPAGTFVVDVDKPGQPRRLSDGYPIAWLPDAERLLIGSKGELFIAGDGDLTQVTNEDGRLWGDVVLSADGRTVIYEVPGDGNAVVYSFALETGQRKLIFHAPGGVTGLSVHRQAR